MSYKLKANGNGGVEVIKKAGSAFVKTAFPVGKCEGLIATGKAEKSDKFDGFGICVNGEYYFAGSFTPDNAKAEPKTEAKPKKAAPAKKTTSATKKKA